VPEYTNNYWIEFPLAAEDRKPMKKPSLLLMSTRAATKIARHIPGFPFYVEARSIRDGRVGALVHFPFGALSEEEVILLRLAFASFRTTALSAMPWNAEHMVSYQC
jgi:hypothetical protein